MTKQLLHSSSHIAVPNEVALCPYCNRPLSVGFQAWEQNDDGTYSVNEIETECATELEMLQNSQAFDEDEWDEFQVGHSVMPYVYQLPVEVKIMAWVNEHYWFDIENEK